MDYTFIMSDYSYPEDHRKKTEKRLRDQVKGNGIDPETLHLEIKRQGIGEFTARTSYKVEAHTETKSAKGKVIEGTLVSQGELKNHIDEAIQKIQRDKSMQDAVEDQIKNLPHHGFGSHKEILPLTHSKQSFTEHRVCVTCNGQKNTQCRICHGQGRMQCRLCNGLGALQCMTCGGQGHIRGSDGNPQPCGTCQGRRQVYCTECQGQQVVTCATCQAKGMMTCNACQGEGMSSNIVTVSAIAFTSSQINVQELDDEPKRLITSVGAEKLIQGDHADIAVTAKPVIEEKETAWYEDKIETDVSGVYYKFTCPWAAGDITLGKKSYEIGFVGKKGAVATCKNIMDDIFQKPHDLLRKAGAGDGLITGLLKEACDYRVSRETLALVVKGKKKRAMQALMKSYGLGLSQNTTKSFIINGFNALKRVTRRPRYIGLAVGLAVVTGLYYAWFGINLREATEPQTQNIRFLIDFVILLVGSGIAFAAVKTAGFIALKSVMDGIGLPIKKVPSAGTAGFYALGGSFLLWCGFLGILFF
jgi:hypothetical protein